MGEEGEPVRPSGKALVRLVSKKDLGLIPASALLFIQEWWSVDSLLTASVSYFNETLKRLSQEGAQAHISQQGLQTKQVPPCEQSSL